MKLDTFIQKNKNTFRSKESRKIWFGKYRGFEVKDIPTDYMNWYIGNYDVKQDKSSFRRFERKALLMFQLEINKRNERLTLQK